MKTRKLLAAIAAAVVSASAMVVSASAATAYLAFQTGTYCYRDSYDNATNGYGTPQFEAFNVNCDTKEPDFKPEIEDLFDYDVEHYLCPADFTNAELTTDGKYKIEVDTDYWGVNKDTSFNLILISTDIPYNEDIKVTSATVYVDGAAAGTFTDVPIEQNKDVCLFNCVNIWNPTIDNKATAYPTKSLAVEFEITGIGAAADTPMLISDNASSDAASPAAGDVDAATDSSKGSPDTGIESVAAIAGLAILAGAGIACTRKRK